MTPIASGWHEAALLAAAVLCAAAVGGWVGISAQAYARLVAARVPPDAGCLLMACRYGAGRLARFVLARFVVGGRGRALGIRASYDERVSALCGAGFLAALVWLAWLQYGPSPSFALAVAAGVLLVAMALVDARCGLLPDALTLPMLWLGMLRSAAGHGVAPQAAILGAALAYASLWILFALFKLWRKQEGMGRGDFKLFAALGAWLGPHALPSVLLHACLAMIAVAMWRQRRLAPVGAAPFGPFLAAAGAAALVWPLPTLAS